VICQIPYNATACREIADNLATPIVKLSLDLLLNHETVCKKLRFCRYPIFVPDNEKDYIYRVLENKPPVKRPVINPNGETFTFAAFGDLHVDKYYMPGSEAQCGFSICCRRTVSTNQTVKQKAGKWGTMSECDIPIVRK
jgi:hypothetical protein